MRVDNKTKPSSTDDLPIPIPIVSTEGIEVDKAKQRSPDHFPKDKKITAFEKSVPSSNDYALNLRREKVKKVTTEELPEASTEDTPKSSAARLLDFDKQLLGRYDDVKKQHEEDNKENINTKDHVHSKFLESQ